MENIQDCSSSTTTWEFILGMFLVYVQFYYNIYPAMPGTDLASLG